MENQCWPERGEQPADTERRAKRQTALSWDMVICALPGIPGLGEASPFINDALARIRRHAIIAGPMRSISISIGAEEVVFFGASLVGAAANFAISLQNRAAQ